jgi:hypothetical protein
VGGTRTDFGIFGVRSKEGNRRGRSWSSFWYRVWDCGVRDVSLGVRAEVVI